MTKEFEVNGMELIVKTFVPDDQFSGKSEENANKLCDDYLKSHPELEEVFRVITYDMYDHIESCYKHSTSVTYAVCIYRIG